MASLRSSISDSANIWRHYPATTTDRLSSTWRAIPRPAPFSGRWSICLRNRLPAGNRISAAPPIELEQRGVRRLSRWLLPVAALLVAIVASVWWSDSLRRLLIQPRNHTVAIPEKKNVAILPFQVQSQQSLSQILADGL